MATIFKAFANCPSSIGGGGRYDDLVARFNGQSIPATGFSLGVSRFASILKTNRLRKNFHSEMPVLICNFDKGLTVDYFKLLDELHKADIKAEIFAGSGGLKKQLKYADKRQLKYALIMGSTEVAKNTVTVKNLVLGKKNAKKIKSHSEWKLENDAQVSLPRNSIVQYLKQAD